MNFVTFIVICFSCGCLGYGNYPAAQVLALIAIANALVALKEKP